MQVRKGDASSVEEPKVLPGRQASIDHEDRLGCTLCAGMYGALTLGNVRPHVCPYGGGRKNNGRSLSHNMSQINSGNELNEIEAFLTSPHVCLAQLYVVI